MVALDVTGEALADGRAVTSTFWPTETRSRHAGARLDSAADFGSTAEFLEGVPGFDTRFGEMAGFRLGHARGLALAERHLQGA